MKKVLVTGAGGFIGSHLVEHLVAEGYSVRAFVHYHSSHSCGWLDHLPTEILRSVEIFPGDICDSQRVERAMQGMDAVFHLAALISIPYSYVSPDRFLAVNTGGTLHVLQAAKKWGTSRVLITSTSEVYGSAQYTPIDEKHPFRAQSPYSASKIGADQMALAFHRSFGVPVSVVRPFNTYGPRQSARAVIPAVIVQLLNHLPEIRLGDLRPTRDWVYVKDTVRAFEVISRSEEAMGQEINVATSREVSVGDMAQMLIRKLHPAATIVEDDQRLRPPESEVMRLCGDPGKLLRATGWAPQTKLEEGLDETIAWFAEGNHLDGYKPATYHI